ncbi:uncharacterized protein MONBRDRAFT_30457 [Monosiga brevicollis MX1]|uniref:Trafficking protein particle complex subunit 12 n=1 Tax=Monosiga brevicollis TaxID=81824 RepID=A9VDZ7_MONBE|nr:uncharacterized protein MONBRDRAFT_30457 [Monosiga brevicollis MX1]EDQ84223.1 predicted protein [Monosiga brevicollis MX1]|eukprot:XP_001750947.1 hypothetical protein [Monosiga brevicollis MX1]
MEGDLVVAPLDGGLVQDEAESEEVEVDLNEEPRPPVAQRDSAAMIAMEEEEAAAAAAAEGEEERAGDGAEEVEKNQAKSHGDDRQTPADQDDALPTESSETGPSSWPAASSEEAPSALVPTPEAKGIESLSATTDEPSVISATPVDTAIHTLSESTASDAATVISEHEADATPTPASTAAVKPKRGHRRMDSAGLNQLDLNSFSAGPDQGAALSRDRLSTVDDNDDVNDGPIAAPGAQLESPPGEALEAGVASTPNNTAAVLLEDAPQDSNASNNASPSSSRRSTSLSSRPTTAGSDSIAAPATWDGYSSRAAQWPLSASILPDQLAQFAHKQGVEAISRHHPSQSTTNSPAAYVTTSDWLERASEEEQLQTLRDLTASGSFSMVFPLNLRSPMHMACVNVLHRTTLLIKAHGEKAPTSFYMQCYARQVWLIRAIMMIKFKLHEALASELDSFGGWDRPDLFYQAYPNKYPHRTGSMVPFSLRFIHAELPLHSKQSLLTMDRFCLLRAVCNQALATVPEDAAMSSQQRLVRELWVARLRRVILSLSNLLLRLNDLSSASAMFSQLLELDDDHVMLYSCLGRMALSHGHLSLAAKHFSLADAAAQKRHQLSDRRQLAINDALLQLCNGNANASVEALAAIADDVENDGAVVNAQAVAQLYSGDLSAAVATFEEELPSMSTLSEEMLYNLATCYELESEPVKAGFKKRVWIRTVLEKGHDNLDVTCLKV